MCFVGLGLVLWCFDGDCGVGLVDLVFAGCYSMWFWVCLACGGFLV